MIAAPPTYCPYFGPLAIWTHMQLSVVVFVGLLIVQASILRGQVSAEPLQS